MQKEVNKVMKLWKIKKGESHTKELVYIHLVEEVGEVARQLVNQGVRKEQYDPEKFEHDIGDVIVFCTYLASLYGLDVEEIVKKVIKEDNIFLDKVKKIDLESS